MWIKSLAFTVSQTADIRKVGPCPLLLSSLAITCSLRCQRSSVFTHNINYRTRELSCLMYTCMCASTCEMYCRWVLVKAKGQMCSSAILYFVSETDSFTEPALADLTRLACQWVQSSSCIVFSSHKDIRFPALTPCFFYIIMTITFIFSYLWASTLPTKPSPQPSTCF